jgi:hypothetical protein
MSTGGGIRLEPRTREGRPCPRRTVAIPQTPEDEPGVYEHRRRNPSRACSPRREPPTRFRHRQPDEKADSHREPPRTKHRVRRGNGDWRPPQCGTGTEEPKYVYALPKYVSPGNSVRPTVRASEKPQSKKGTTKPAARKRKALSPANCPEEEGGSGERGKGEQKQQKAQKGQDLYCLIIEERARITP